MLIKDEEKILEQMLIQIAFMPEHLFAVRSYPSVFEKIKEKIIEFAKNPQRVDGTFHLMRKASVPSSFALQDPFTLGFLDFNAKLDSTQLTKEEEALIKEMRNEAN